MYLKEIEIQGFKSFADKTKVVFDQGPMVLENLTSQKVYAGLLGNPVSKVFVAGRCQMLSLQGQKVENH